MSYEEDLQGKEFILSFMECFFNGAAPKAAIYLINPSSLTSASVRVVTPLLTSGPASIDQNLIMSPASKMRIPVQYELFLDGTAKEDKGT